MSIEFENKEFDYFKGKNSDKLYVSKRIETKQTRFENSRIVEKIVPIRYASKVIDSNNHFQYIKEKDEVRIRITPEGRQEITAKFLEDSKGIFILQLQKFTVDKGSPHKTFFSFRGEEIKTLYNFICNIKNLQFDDEKGFNILDSEIKKLILTKEQAFSIYFENQKLFEEILSENVTEDEIINLLYRKKQLNYFENLIESDEFFENEKKRLNISKDEALWQNFFEINTWIFGFGLQYIINIPLQDKKLEQVVDGFDVINRGKRADAFMKTKGIINSLCFAEIKTHKTKLLASEYRPNVYPPSNELSGGISQIHKTILSSIANLSNKITPTDRNGDPTGEEIFIYKPKSFLLVGNLEEFLTKKGINKEKYASFELYRRSITDVEIITFDELLERARFIINLNE